MKSKKEKKPKVIINLTKKPLKCGDICLRNCIAHPVLKVLKKTDPEKAEKFKTEYNGLCNRREEYYNLHGQVFEDRKHFYFGEFFTLASKYVELIYTPIIHMPE